jgi:polyisoprenoid-binding protein YceI
MGPAEILGTTKRWVLTGLDFAVHTGLGPAIRGHFAHVGGVYEAGPDGTSIQLVVDVTSVEAGRGIWEGLLRSGPLTENPQVRFASTVVRDLGDGRLRVEGYLEAAGKVEPISLDASVKEAGGGIRLETATIVDRQRVGASADRFAFFLPATVQVTLRFAA